MACCVAMALVVAWVREGWFRLFPARRPAVVLFPSPPRRPAPTAPAATPAAAPVPPAPAPLPVAAAPGAARPAAVTARTA
jgi:hypothetical protein